VIIVKLIGGLGNQMFQYAAARRLASFHNTSLKLDVFFLQGKQKGYKPRRYELHHLNITATIASSFEVAQLSGKGRSILQTGFVRFLQRMKLAKLYPNVIAEPHYHFDPALLHAKDNAYLTGYWQSEKYFSDIQEIIRRDFTAKKPLEGKNLELAKKIWSPQSVSLHIRRGDYVSNPQTMKLHQACGMDYYQQCVDYLSRQIKAPHFFIFSDDPMWVSKNLNLGVPFTFVDHNPPKNGYEDLRLMSLCKHHIIANSSFSWWGAWLNQNPGKIVLAPKKWFNSVGYNTKGLIPDEWLKI
jgi:Glycosyl transferase family 11